MADSQAAPDANVLVVRNLRIEATVRPPGEKPHDILIVDNVSLTLQKGRVLGLIGESGAGKSTIGLSALGYGRGGVRITGGEVFLNGRDILKGGASGLRALRGKEVSYVAQSAAAAFNPSHRLMGQVVESAMHHGVANRAQAEQRAVALFKKLGLPDPENFGQRFPHQVSGGQLQRAMTAMALCAEPDLIVFDEPTTALDVTVQKEVLKLMNELVAQERSSLIFVSHDLPVVSAMTETIAVMRNGKVVEHTTVSELFHNPLHEYSRKLIDTARATEAEFKRFAIGTN